jgi:hypothetical protein
MFWQLDLLVMPMVIVAVIVVVCLLCAVWVNFERVSWDAV